MKKVLMLFLALLLVQLSQGQSIVDFPKNWLGNWEGELSWYSGNSNSPKKVKMQLNIQPADTLGHYTWQLIYGEQSEDNRPYILKPVDASKGHWVIDERNGIALDQFWAGPVFSGAFSIQGSTIVNNYKLEKDRLIVEFYSLLTKPVRQSGNGTQESPLVDSYAVRSYQKAILKRKKK
jgi:hypothetical protein